MKYYDIQNLKKQYFLVKVNMLAYHFNLQYINILLRQEPRRKLN